MRQHTFLTYKAVDFRYLGGKWDPVKLTLQVQSVFPCSLNNPADQTECTVLQNKIRELITQQVGLRLNSLEPGTWYMIQSLEGLATNLIETKC